MSLCHDYQSAQGKEEEEGAKADHLRDEGARLRTLQVGISSEVCFGLHHVNPDEKEFQFNNLYDVSIEKLKREIEKCILLCSNCHRIEHQRLRDM